MELTLKGVSFVTSSYNEVDCHEFFKDYLRLLSSCLEQPSEIIVVDNCSSDIQNLIKLRDIERENSFVKVVSNTSSLGWGDGVRTGISSAHNNLICIFPSDMQYYVEDLVDLACEMKKYHLPTVIVTKRLRFDGYLFNVRSFVWRKILLLFGVPSSDPMSQLRGYCGKDLLSFSNLAHDFMWDVECLLLCKPKANFVEKEVRFRARFCGKTSTQGFFRMGFKSFKVLVQLRKKYN